MRFAIPLLVCCSLSSSAAAQDAATLTPKTLQAALAAKPQGAAADALVDKIKGFFGGTDALLKGAPAKIDELTVAWALEIPQLAPNVTPRVVADVGFLNVPLARIGTSDVYAAAATLANGTAFS